MHGLTKKEVEDNRKNMAQTVLATSKLIVFLSYY